MIANKHHKKAFEGDCLRKLREASAFITISVNAKISKDQQKINFLQLWGHLKTLKFLINFCTILKVLRRSNFLLLLCSKRKTKIFFTPPYCPVVNFVFLHRHENSYLLFHPRFSLI